MAEPEFFSNPDGSMYHIGLKKHEISQRVIIVGSHKRATMMKAFLDDSTPTSVTTVLSDRLYLTYTGNYKGVRVSIVGIGMGAPMVEFFVREAMYLLRSPMAIIRLGTCGSLNPHFTVGTVAVAESSSYFYTNYAAFHGVLGYFPVSEEEKNVLAKDSLPKPADSSSSLPKFIISKPLPASPELTHLLVQELESTKNRVPRVGKGLNCSCELFYSTQARNSGGLFESSNDGIMEELCKCGISTMEMETHQLFFSASLCRVPVLTAGCAVVVKQRNSAAEESTAAVETVIEKAVSGAAIACLEAITKIELPVLQ